MFQRLVFQDSAALYTIAAFCVASSIFVAFAWRAVRMKRSQVDRLGRLPFDTATPASKHEPKSKSAPD
ncbi:MAG TPA: hypothetical protein VKG78_09475 [Opitutaceae bacterium]|nr:hypothetical protein [Opitutaceae bacterium]